MLCVVFFKQKTAYEMRISDWSSDVCSSDLQAYLNLQRSSIVAPVSGYVAQRQVQLGQRVQPGTTLMTIVPLEQMWVEANFKETQLTKMHIGQPAEVHADLYGGDVTYDGTLDRKSTRLNSSHK